MKISSNTVLITGGASGIGFALAKKFVELENTVIVVGRNQEKLNQAKEKIKSLIAIQCDLSNQSNLESLVVEVGEKYHGVNILINNAAVQYNYDLTEEITPFNKIDSETSINFIAPVKLSTLLIPILSYKSNAAIVNLTSGLAFAPKVGAPIYCPTKAALHNFTQIFRYQLEKLGIKVFELIPPLVETDMTAGRDNGKISPHIVADEFIKAFEKDIYEISVGKIKLLKLGLRLFPSLIKRKMRENN